MAEVQWGDELKYEAVNVLESFVVNEVQSLEGLVARSVRWHRLLALSVVNRHPIGTLAQGLK